jgi:hypothetical protein
MGVFTGIFSMFHEVAMAYLALFQQLKLDAVNLGRLLFAGSVADLPHRLSAAVDSLGAEIGKASIIGGSLPTNLTSFMLEKNVSMFQKSVIHVVNSPKFHLVAPTCLGLALIIIILTIELSPDAPPPQVPPVVECVPTPAKPVIVPSVEQQSQIKKFAANKVYIR